MGRRGGARHLLRTGVELRGERLVVGGVEVFLHLRENLCRAEWKRDRVDTGDASRAVPHRLQAPRRLRLCDSEARARALALSAAARSATASARRDIGNHATQAYAAAERASVRERAPRRRNDAAIAPNLRER